MPDETKKCHINTIFISFDLEIEEDGWPPISTEILQALPLGNGKAQIDNTPFFITSIALGDVVKVSKPDGMKYFRCDELIEEGGNYALSIILRDHQSQDELILLLSEKEYFYEYGEFGNTKMYAVSVNEEKAFNKIKVQLDKLEAREVISYAELCIA